MSMLQKKPEEAKAILTQGKDGDFWRILCESITDQINDCEIQRTRLGELSSNDYMIQNEILIGKIAFLKELQKLPESLIEFSEMPDIKEVDHDPYDKT